MKKTVSTDGWPTTRPRLAGVVYLFYFLAAILSQSLHGRAPIFFSDAIALLSTGLYVALAWLLFVLFVPVNARVSLIAAIASTAGCIVQVLSLFHLANEREALVLFACYCVLIGSLIVQSVFLPRILGGLMILAGLGWFVYLLPSVPTAASMTLEALGILAELALMLWLLVFGVDVRRWAAGAR